MPYIGAFARYQELDRELAGCLFGSYIKYKRFVIWNWAFRSNLFGSLNKFSEVKKGLYEIGLSRCIRAIEHS
jgi:hypothetical protein